MQSNPWEDNLDRSSSESDIEQTPDETAFKRTEKDGYVTESRYYRNEDGALCEENTRFKSFYRVVAVNQAARERISSMKPFGKEEMVGTKAGRSARGEVEYWKREKTGMMSVATAEEEDFSLSCYGQSGGDQFPLRRRGNLIEELFKKLADTTLLTDEDLENAAAGTAMRPGSTMGGREPKRMLGGNPEERTIRISNLNENITEDHLRGLLKEIIPKLMRTPPTVGGPPSITRPGMRKLREGPASKGMKREAKVEKCYVPKDELTKASRGFAFVTLSDPELAKACISKLNGHTFDTVVLAVEMAKPAKRDGGGMVRFNPGR